MTSLAFDFGEKLGLSNSELNRLFLLSTLHDIGKITIEKEILSKPGKLTDREWEAIKKHPENGYKIANSSEEFALVAEEVFSHHERWDGSGYPRQLNEKDIPYLARIISIIDAYDVMTNDRPYSKALSKRDTLKEIRACAGSQFDPELADNFVQMIS
jgi:HD-GYP domain-containing protein (c-di-GMP phosphodiesterase class II)